MLYSNYWFLVLLKGSLITCIKSNLKIISVGKFEEEYLISFPQTFKSLFRLPSPSFMDTFWSSTVKRVFQAIFILKELIISIALAHNLAEGRAYFKPPLFLLSCYCFITVHLPVFPAHPFSIPEGSFPPLSQPCWPCRCFTLSFQSWHSTTRTSRNQLQLCIADFTETFLFSQNASSVPGLSPHWSNAQGAAFPCDPCTTGSSWAPSLLPSSCPKAVMTGTALAEEGAQAAMDTWLWGRDRWAWSGSGSEAELTHCSVHTAQLSQGVPYPRNLLGSSPFSSSHNWLLLRKQNLSIHCYLLTCLDSVFLLVTTEIPIFTSSASEKERPGLAEIESIFMNVRKTTFLTLAGWEKERGE